MYEYSTISLGSNSLTFFDLSNLDMKIFALSSCIFFYIYCLTGLLEACIFLKRKQRGMSLGNRGGEGELEKGKGGETVVGI